MLISILMASTAIAQVPADTPQMKKEKAMMAQYTAQYVKAKAGFTKSPKNAKLKKAYVIATVRLGTATMTTPSLPPREKYRGALRYYREALKVDPKNVEAKTNKDMIEAIYKKMGRPIPKD